ncbi:hypothetical protein DW828_18885 [Parabacteroides merdae]|uniref:Uncharacterized protein n=1 Tax=Parabacteroides merdae TaxID=46503 RepID=A0A414BSB0_9BACT|nr:hypothetical protein DW828_18885 [Parabacteroides merdae]
MFWFKLSTIIFDPHEAIKKNPNVMAQQTISGRLGRSKCKDSAVAQQLIAANAKKAIKENSFK